MVRAARPGRIRRGLCLLITLAAGCALGPLVACVDLFHSTDFSVADAGDAGPASHPGDATKPRDAGPDARDAATDAKSGQPGDATLDHQATDAVVESGRTHEGGVDALPEGSTVEAGGAEGGGSGDAGPDFCAFTSQQAQDYATHACLWLGACVGTGDLNAFGLCYPLALQAYDCTLNPNQKVRGALHAYWDALRTVTTCSEVQAAVFGRTPPACNNASIFCGKDLVDGGAFANVAVRCSGEKIMSAVNCSMAGWTCSEVTGGCAIAPYSTGHCSDTPLPAPDCEANVFHSCQTVETDSGTGTTIVDVGKDCTNFGGGTCVATTGGPQGCVPNDAGVACAVSPAAACGDGGSVTGCATGVVETLRCLEFGAGTPCAIGADWRASSSQLPMGCYNPTQNGGASTTTECMGDGFQVYAGPCAAVQVGCGDNGFDGGCITTPPADYQPYCQF